MRLETKVFELCNGKYGSLSDLANAMGISIAFVSKKGQVPRQPEVHHRGNKSFSQIQT